MGHRIGVSCGRLKWAGFALPQGLYGSFLAAVAAGVSYWDSTAKFFILAPPRGWFSGLESAI
jgi:hypothetical protein